MNKRGPVVLLVTLITALSLLLIFFLYNSKEVERKMRLQNEAELRQKISELSEKDSLLAELKKQKEEIVEQLNSVISGLETSLKKANKDAETLSDKIRSLAEDKDSLKREVDDKTSELEDLSDRIKDLERDKADLLKNIREAEEERVSGGAGKQEVKKAPAAPSAKFLYPIDAVKLGKIVVQKNSGRPTEVKYVDKLYGFIVISAGTRDGLLKDSVVNIIRDNQLIGKAVVQKANDNLSAAVLLPEWTLQEIQTGGLITRF